METYMQLPLNKDDLAKISNNAKEYAMSNGLMMGSRYFEEDMVSFSPFCLLPSSFSKQWFEYAKEIQPVLNVLVHKVAHNYEFLKKCLRRTIESDDFTKRLFQIYETVLEEGLTQELCLGLLRADYMLDTDNSGKISGLKQVEINTFASSFGGLTTRLHSLHSYLLKPLNVDLSKFPGPNADRLLANGLVAAWDLYGEKRAAILILIEDNPYNFSDQRILEYAVLNINPDIKVFRCTFAEVENLGNLEDSKFFVGNQEVSVIYFRTGYVPHQYKSEKTWESRLMMERSKAIKCPSIHYHLAGTKKVQQELAQPGILEQFLTDPEEVEKIRAIFAAQFPLDLTEEGDKACQLALSNPERYVMKPQREGGGNNLYGDDLVSELNKIKKAKEREGYILMELIIPPPTPNYILRPKQEIELSNVFSELGIFGVVIGNSKEILTNFEAGHMLRSKIQGTNEGGVAAGYGCLDLPYLV